MAAEIPFAQHTLCPPLRRRLALLAGGLPEHLRHFNAFLLCRKRIQLSRVLGLESDEEEEEVQACVLARRDPTAHPAGQGLQGYLVHKKLPPS